MNKKKFVVLAFLNIFFLLAGFITGFLLRPEGYRGGSQEVVVGLSLLTQNVEFVNNENLAVPTVYKTLANGTVKEAEEQELWFIASNVYVQFGFIKQRPNAKSEFADEMQIILRKNAEIKTTLTVSKPFVLLDDFTFGAKWDKTNFRPDTRSELLVKYDPIGASLKGVEYEVVQGTEHAVITDGNKLSVLPAAVVGEQFTVKASFVSTDPRQPDIEKEKTFNVVDFIPITTAQEFYDIRENYANDYYLANDIDLSEYYNWQPIPEFYGILDGRGKAIKNATITTYVKNESEVNMQGIFAYNGGHIYDMQLENIAVKQTTGYADRLYSGALAGISHGNINNITASAIEINVRSYNGATGGIVGFVSKAEKAEDLSIDGLTLYSTARSIGGLIGAVDPGMRVQNGFVTNATIQVFSYRVANIVGGLVGQCVRGSLLNSQVTNSDIIFVGSQGVAVSRLQPIIGKVVGLLNSASFYGLTMSEVFIDTGTLSSEAYGGGSLPINQLYYIGNGTNGWVGRLQEAQQ